MHTELVLYRWPIHNWSITDAKNEIRKLPAGTRLIGTGGNEKDWIEVYDPHEQSKVGWVLTDTRHVMLARHTLCTPEADDIRTGGLLGEPDLLEFWKSMDDLLTHNLNHDDFDCLRMSTQIGEKGWLPGYFASNDVTSYMQYQSGIWRCEQCGFTIDGQHQEKSIAIDSSLISDTRCNFLGLERLLGRLAERHFFSPAMTPPVGDFQTQGRSFSMVKKEFVITALDLAKTVNEVLGRRHWTVQWARMLFVDLTLSKLMYNNKVHNHVDLYFNLLWTLDVLWQWVQSLNLPHHPGCFLHDRNKITQGILKHENHRLDDRCKWLLFKLEERLQKKDGDVLMDILPVKNMAVEDSISFQ